MSKFDTYISLSYLTHSLRSLAPPSSLSLSLSYSPLTLHVFLSFSLINNVTLGGVAPVVHLIVYFRKHTYSLLELHISITESEQITNTQIYKYVFYSIRSTLGMSVTGPHICMDNYSHARLWTRIQYKRASASESNCSALDSNSKVKFLCINHHLNDL